MKKYEQNNIPNLLEPPLPQWNNQFGDSFPDLSNIVIKKSFQLLLKEVFLVCLEVLVFFGVARVFHLF